MRAAPSLQVTIVRRGPWRLALVTLAAASAATCSYWAGLRLGVLPAWNALTMLGAAGLASLAAWRVSRLAPLDLRFDGQRWECAPSGMANAQACAGTIGVVIDLGHWMLLRFDAATSAPQGRGPQWLPVSRARLGRQWHLLRCAVCAPRSNDVAGAAER